MTTAPITTDETHIVDLTGYGDDPAVTRLELRDLMVLPYVHELIGHFHSEAMGTGPAIYDDADAEDRADLQREFVEKAGAKLAHTIRLHLEAKSNPALTMHPSRNFNDDAGNFILQIVTFGALAYVRDLCRAQRAEMGIA